MVTGVFTKSSSESRDSEDDFLYRGTGFYVKMWKLSEHIEKVICHLTIVMTKKTKKIPNKV